MMGKKDSSGESRAYLREYLFLLLFFAVTMALLAILSFHPADPSWFGRTVGTASRGAEHNLFGPTGATFAAWMIQLGGLGAPLTLLILLVQTILAFRKTETRASWTHRAIGLPQLLLCYVALIATIAPTWTYKEVTFFSGGIIGNGISGFFISLFGKTGAIAALLFGLGASLPLALGLRPLSLLARLLSWAPWKEGRTLAHEITREKGRALSQEAHEDEEQPEPTYDIRPETRQNPVPIVAPGIGQALATNHQSARVEKDESTVVLPTSGTPAQISLRTQEFPEILTLLKDYQTRAPSSRQQEEENARLRQEATILEEKLSTFGVLGKVVHSQPGPVVNVHEFEPAPGIKVSRVMGLQDDLALGLKAQSVLMAPQPGKSTIGVEIPAQQREVVYLREILDAPEFTNSKATLPMALGKLVDGKPLVVDLASMPHLLVAGSTGSGKSVGINVMLLSLMTRHTPDHVRFILVDPKMLELSTYDGIGHLLMPVVTDPQKAAGALRWAIDEMERRYRLMKRLQVRSVYSYNQVIEAGEVPAGVFEESYQPERLPYIVVVIDELCDLMMTAPKDVEDCVQRLAQKARAAGIHLLLATQRPSVDVLTGVIKANLPCRLSFQVASKHDSRTIVETIGAEKLLGKGDMLFLPPGTSRLLRSHCAFVGDQEIASVANRLREIFPTSYNNEIMREVDRASEELAQPGTNDTSEKIDGEGVNGNEMDENTLYERAVAFAVDTGTVSTSSIQRHFRIGYNRAARLMDRMVKEQLVAHSEVAGKPRQVLAAQRQL
jgi:S-DNA-T family DNA segregation ATPase FtsK/SpoIIIE